MNPFILTDFTVTSPKLIRPLELAVASDYHSNTDIEGALAALKGADAILMPGDMVDRHKDDFSHAEEFLRRAAELAPVIASFGNHERRHPRAEAVREMLFRAPITLLDDTVTTFGGITIGGITSRDKKDIVRMDAVDTLSRAEGFRLLLCHHPEYYGRYVKGHGIDLTLAGHAHGGQIQLFGHGLYAPGQGLFPRLTDGFYDGGQLLVSRGMTNNTFAPRLWCPCEVLRLHLRPEEHA